MSPRTRCVGAAQGLPQRLHIRAECQLPEQATVLPIDFPPWQTEYEHFTRLNNRGVTERVLTELREQIRVAHGRQPEPTTGICDSQSVKVPTPDGADDANTKPEPATTDDAATPDQLPLQY